MLGMTDYLGYVTYVLLGNFHSLDNNTTTISNPSASTASNSTSTTTTQHYTQTTTTLLTPGEVIFKYAVSFLSLVIISLVAIVFAFYMRKKKNKN